MIPDWNLKLKNRQSIIPPPLYPKEAQRALSIFKRLRIPDLPGKPTFGEVSEQWVFDFVAVVFGAYDRENKKQMIDEYLLLISKKNTKSTIGAAIMITALILSERENEELLILAPTKEVAGNSFEPAVGMIKADPVLMRQFKIQEHIKTITMLSTNNKLKVVAADSDAVGGKKAGRVLVDELWLFGKSIKASRMFREALGGLASRPEGFVVFLTTMSDEPPAGIFKTKLHYHRKVRDGTVIDPKTLPILYEFDREMLEKKEYLNPDNFYITNPNLGRSVSLEWLQDELKKAKEGGDDELQIFCAKHLNVETEMSLAGDVWVGAELWQDCEVALSLDDLIDNSELITVGIDGGGLDDLLGVYVLGRTADKKMLGWGYGYANRIVLERRKEIASRLIDFRSNNELAIIDEVGADIEQLVDLIMSIKETGKLYQVGLDPAGVSQIVEKMNAYGLVEAEDYIGVSQGWKLGTAIKTVERWLGAGTLQVAEQAIMRWSASNAKVEARANGIMITKQKSGTAKIDLLIALFVATAIMVTAEDVNGNINDFLRGVG